MDRKKGGRKEKERRREGGKERRKETEKNGRKERGKEGREVRLPVCAHREAES